MIKGSIPEEVTIFKGKKEDYRIKLEGQETFVVSGIPFFAADKGSEKTASSWGKSSGKVKNEPFKIRIFDIEVRGRGGRAWKIMIKDENLVCDLREDILLDIFYNCDIMKGGYVDGDFIFAKVNSEMKVIRQHSRLHYAIKKHEGEKSKKPISNLIVGRLYKTTEDTSDIMYLGQRWTVDKKLNPQLVYVFSHNFNSHSYLSAEIKKSHSYRFEEIPKEKVCDATIDNFINKLVKQYEKYLLSHYKHIKDGTLYYKSDYYKKQCLDYIKYMCLSKTKGFIHPEVSAVYKELTK